MKSRKQETASRFIPLNKLKKSAKNRRKVPHTKAHIKALADNISVLGQIQNLVVEPELDEQSRPTGNYLVTVGEGRRLAHLLRVKQKKIKADEPIRCVIDDVHNAHAVSLAENVLHEQMHPADQFEAFRLLVDGGSSIEEVAAQFSVSPLVVQRRLKLANVAPQFLAMYREGKVSLDHMMALALTDDHAKQTEVWESLPRTNRHPHSLRRALTANEISVREPMVKFVGIKAYEKAGGIIRRDLFAEQADDGFILDPDLLRRLAKEKLDKEARKFKEEGYAWVDTALELDLAALSVYRRVRTIVRPAKPKEQEKLDELTQQREAVERQIEATGEDDEQSGALCERAEEIDELIQNLRDALTIPDPAQQALAGAIVSVGQDGRLRIDRNLLRPDDAKRLARENDGGEKEAGPNTPRVHSVALNRRLSAHRTLALQATLAQRPDVALVVLTHRLALGAFYEGRSSLRSALHVTAEHRRLAQYAPDVASCKAQTTLSQQAETLRAALPDDPGALFAWLLQQPQAALMSLCAYCVARAVDGVSDEETNSQLDPVAAAVGLDMREWWTPTAQNYLGSVTKARILEVLKEAISPEVAATLNSLNKKPLAEAAERRLASTGWLPGPLRKVAA